MTSPDFTEYVDLTINDAQPEEIYNNSLTYALTTLPEFSPRQGTVEDALLQAMAYISGLMSGAINRLPNGILEGVLRFIGLEREEATYATGEVLLTAIDNSGVTIPAGTQVAYVETVDGVTTQYVFRTDQNATIDAGDTTVTTPITALSAGEKPFIASGTTLVILSASSKLLSAAFSGTLTQGVNGESDSDYFTRGATYLSSLSDTLVTPNQFTSHVLANYPAVHRCKTYSNTHIDQSDGVQIFESGGNLGASLILDPNSDFSAVPQAGDFFQIHDASDAKFNGYFEVDSVASSPDQTIYFANTVGASTGETFTGDFHLDMLEGLDTGRSEVGGNVTLAMTGENGVPLSNDEKQEVLDGITPLIIAGLMLTPINGILVEIEVEITIAVLAGYDELSVRTAVDTLITSYLSPDEWDWSNRVRVSAIQARAAQVAGVDYVDSVTIALDAGEAKATIDGSSGDALFAYDGSLPVATVSVGSL